MADLPSARQFGDYGSWPGRAVIDPGGERVGEVREIYLDRETHEPEWVLVKVDGSDDRFVPLADASVEGDAIRVAHRRETVAAAPGIGAEPRIDTEQEHRLYAHYGVPVSDDRSGTVEPEPEPEPEPPAPEAAAAVTPPPETAPAPPPDTPQLEPVPEPAAVTPGVPPVESPTPPPEPPEAPRAPLDTGWSTPPAVTERSRPPASLIAAVVAALLLLVLVRRLRS
jgi:outer membrane biosynthesis protein TonB